MRVFISWSGPNSQSAAQVLVDVIPVVIQAVQPFISVEDLRKGGRWQSELGEALQSTDVGILCLTKTNREAPWLLFEAGALSKSVEESCVIPLLIGLSHSDIRAPLSQFNVTLFDRADVFRMFKDINARLGEKQLPDRVLLQSFNQAWPSMEERINAIAQKEADELAADKPVPEDPLKKVSSAIEEILTILRAQSTSGGSSTPTEKWLNDINSSAILYRYSKNQKSRHAWPPDDDRQVTIDLSDGFLSDLETRRRLFLTMMHDLDVYAQKSNDKVLAARIRKLREVMAPVFRRFFGDDGVTGYAPASAEGDSQAES